MTDRNRHERGFVAEHVAGCEQCGVEAEAVTIQRHAGRIESLLDASSASVVDVRRLSALVLAAAAPLLAGEARRLYGRRLAAGLAVAIAPLPLVYLFAAWTLGRLHALVSALASDLVAAWAVASYASLAALAVALGCAAVPLLIERTLPVALAHGSQRSTA